MSEFHKYVRTPHIQGSRLQQGDHDLEEVPLDELINKYLVIEEKIDGANSGISFSEDGELQLQSRGHYLRGGPRERHFDMFKQWTACHRETLFRVLGSRYVMYGEDMFATHTIFYDALPHYFMEFDILDTKTDTFLSTEERRKLIVSGGAGDIVHSVLVLHDGVYTKLSLRDLGDLTRLVTKSNFITDDRSYSLASAALAAGVSPIDTMKRTDMDPLMEGLYIKWEEGGTVMGRYKYIRPSFTSSILDQDTHWHERPIIHNALVPGAFERMFAQY